MPIEVGIWRIDGAPQKVHFSAIKDEATLEDVLYANIGILDPDLMVIGRQVPTAFNKFIDLLAIDTEGNLTVIELKRNRTPREVVAQVLDYASWVQTLTYEDITAIYAKQYPGQHLEQAFSNHIGSEENPPDSLNEDHNLIVVASELDNSTERIIGYLSSNYGVPINAVFFRYFKEGENEYLTRSWLIDPSKVEAQTDRVPPVKSGKEPWNGTDYHVSLLEDHRRNWEDCRKYGFVSAGGGRWFTRTLKRLSPGARVFVHIPKKGYVGVGTVLDSVTSVRNFTVTVDEAETPILNAPLAALKMDEDADDSERAEHLVRVEWIETRSANEAYWEKGMYANQNSATKLRNKFTLERLVKHFGIEGVE